MSAVEARGATETDGELMGRVATGDVAAFEAIYDRYHRQAYALARRMMGPSGGAEDATQDAFLSLWRGAASFDPKRGRLNTWLFALVRYRSIDVLRRKSSQPRQQEMTEEIVERIEAPERTEDQVLAIQEYDQALRLVAELPPEQREVIHLAYLGGYTQTEIAAKVGVPLGTVKGRARHGLLKLRHAAERESAPPLTS